MSISYANEVQRLRDTFATRKTFQVEWREQQLRRVQAMVRENEPKIAEALSKDLGWSKEATILQEIDMILPEVKYALDNIREWVKSEPAVTPLILKPSTSYVLKEPLGVVLVISPWNYPIHLAINPLIGALAAGNCVVIKPSEITSNCSTLLAKLIPKYLDPSAVTVIEGGVPETTALLKENFDHIIYTGNGKVGRIVLTAAAVHLTPVTLELGGKNPVIVDKDANLDVAARRIIWAKFMNCGQTCTTADYIIAHRDIERELIKKLEKCLTEFYGPDTRRSKDYSRIINQQHCRRLQALLDDDHNYELVCGGVVEEDECYFAPTIVRNVSETSKLMQDEIFGPILPILRCSLFPPGQFIDSAIQFIQKKPKPLAAYVFSGNKRTQTRVVQEVSCGGACINDVLTHSVTPNLPFGGVGESGMGSYHGKGGFDTFSHHKSILHAGTLVDPSLRYPPYSERKVYWLNVMKSINPKIFLMPAAIVLSVLLAFLNPLSSNYNGSWWQYIYTRK